MLTTLVSGKRPLFCRCDTQQSSLAWRGLVGWPEPRAGTRPLQRRPEKSHSKTQEGPLRWWPQ